MRPLARRVELVKKTGRARRREEKFERELDKHVRNVELLVSGEAERAFVEDGVDLLAGSLFSPLSKVGSADGGAGRDQDDLVAVFDPRTPSQRLSDHIRDVINDPERRRERARLKAGGSHDVRDVPPDAPGAVSFPEVPWERGL